MKIIRAFACAALVAASAAVMVGSSGAGAAAGDATPYDFCTKSMSSATAEHVSCTFTETGSHVFKVPAIATSLQVHALGGHGGGLQGLPRPNTFIEAPLGDSVAGRTLVIRVGGDAVEGKGGYNGGGDGVFPGGGGGGASDISLDGARILVAPGGGGTGGPGFDAFNQGMTYGGAGGTWEANDATNGESSTRSCGAELTGGTHGGAGDDGGIAGVGGDTQSCDSEDASFMKTGADGIDGAADGTGGGGGLGSPDGDGDHACGAGGGGGGGYFGGGGGGSGGISPANEPSACGGGGGGGAGSALTPAGPSGAIGLTDDDPSVVISWDQAMAFTSSGKAPAGAVGHAYTYQLSTTVPNSTFRVVSGSTPPGLTLSSAGLLSGTPSTVGTTGFTVEASDPDEAAQRTQVVSVTISAAPTAPVTFTNGTPPGATKGKAYSFQFTAANCPGCTFSRVTTAGGTPPGLKIAGNGVLSGTPTTSGTFKFTVRATDSANRSADYPVSLRVSTAPALTINDVSVQESGGNATFTVTLNPAATGTVTVKYATVNGTAVAPGDYTAKSGTLTFTAGQTSKTVAVPVINDTKHEGAETFKITLSTASGASIADSSGTGTIAASD